MSAYDGSEWIALDSDLVLDVEDGDGSEPLDVAAMQAMWSRARYTLERGSHVSASFACGLGSDDWTDHVGKRPFASVDWSAPIFIPWICVRGQEGVELALTGRLSILPDVTKDGLAEMSFKLELLGIASKQGGVPVTFDATDKDVFDEVKLSLTHRPVSEEVTTHLALWLRSVSGDTYSSVSSATARPGYRFKDAAETIANVSTYRSGGLGSFDPSVACVRDADSGDFFDLMYVVGNSEVVVRPANGSAFLDVDTLQTVHLSYLQIAGGNLRVSVDADGLIGPRERYLPQRTVEAPDDIMIPIAHLEAYRRPSCVWWGPQGVPLPLERDCPEGYHERWVRVRDETGSGVDMLYAAACFAKTDPAVDVLLNLLPFALTIQVRSDGTLENLKELGTTAEWTLTATVESYEPTGGTWDSIGSTSITRDFLHLPTDPAGPWGALQAEYLREHYVTRNGMTGAYVSGSPYCSREGQVWATDVELLELVRIRVPVTYDPAGTAVATRVRVEATMDTGSVVYGQALDADQASVIPSEGSLWLAVVGASIWERADV